jgi:hypothetical protein
MSISFKYLWVVTDPSQENPLLFSSKSSLEDYLTIHRPEVQGKMQSATSVWKYGSGSAQITARRTKVHGSDDLSV